MLEFLIFVLILIVWYEVRYHIAQRRLRKNLKIFYDSLFVSKILAQTCLDNFTKVMPLPVQSGNQIKFFTYKPISPIEEEK